MERMIGRLPGPGYGGLTDRELELQPKWTWLQSGGSSWSRRTPLQRLRSGDHRQIAQLCTDQGLKGIGQEGAGGEGREGGREGGREDRVINSSGYTSCISGFETISLRSDHQGNAMFTIIILCCTCTLVLFAPQDN